MTSSVERSPQAYARICGLMYLGIIVLGIFGEVFVRGALVVSGNPAATAANIAASPLLWRAGIVGDLLMHVLDIPMIVIFYLLFRRVNETLALLAASFNLVQTAVLALNKLSLVVPILLVQGTTSRSLFQLQEVQALSYLAINVHGHGFAIGLTFFGFACLAQGYVIFKCEFLPKVLGLMLQVAGACYLVNSAALLLAPSIAQVLFPAVLLPAFIGELSLALWLVAKGVNVSRFEQRMKA